MIEPYEQRVAIELIWNVTRAASRNRHFLPNLERLVKSAGEELLIESPDGRDLAAPGRAGQGRPAAHLQRLSEAVDARRQELRRARPGTIERNLRRIAERFALDPADAAILGLFVRVRMGSPFEDIFDALLRHNASGALLRRWAGALLAMPQGDIAARLAPEGRLATAGLVTIDADGSVEILRPLVRAVGLATSKRELERALLPRPSSARLGLEQFDYVSADRDRILRILDGALARGSRGVHILLYGPPGTGKTELCKTIASALGADLHAVGEHDQHGGEPERHERIAAYRLAQQLLADARRPLILFDEAEDLFGNGLDGLFALLGGRHRHASGSRAFIHRMLESTGVPTLWTTNALEPIGVPVLRRMTYALQVAKPSLAARARIWADALADAGIAADPCAVHDLARDFDEAPALAVTAARAATLAQGGLAEVRAAMEGMATVLRAGVPAPPAVRRETEFNRALAAADADLESIEERLASGSERAVSFCLYGPPGTGKSAWARHLAARLDMEVMHVRASDLLGSYVGETEGNIARAFSRARAERRFLVFDEADSFLGERRCAARSWEVTAVNEMLTWMETHGEPFACTTNLADRIDAAAQRRFTFRIRFGYLSAGQAGAAFRAFFGLEPPVGLAALDVLTPGDFAVIARRARLTGAETNATALFAMLRAECAAKPDHRHPIGFTV